MKLLIDIQNLDKYKSRDQLPLECQNCHRIFYIEKHYIQPVIKYNSKKYCYCSNKCGAANKRNGQIFKCVQCQKEIYKSPSNSYDKRKKSTRVFCSTRCAGLYNSQHRTFGIRRSKLEVWLERQLKLIYPKLEIQYNNSSIILIELDIYIPSLRIAFELNGPLHYEPLFGLEKFTEIQKRDKRKILTCAEHNIELVVIDVSKFKYFKPEKAKIFLDMITTIINDKLVPLAGNAPATRCRLAT